MEPAEELRYLVLGAQREGARTFAELLRPMGLTPAEAEVLAVLRDAGRPLTVREIGARLVCEGGSPSRLVSSIVAVGLLKRGERPTDRRAVELSLTPAARRSARDVGVAERELHDGLAAQLSDREIAVMLRGLHKLVAYRPAGHALTLRRDRR